MDVQEDTPQPSSASEHATAPDPSVPPNPGEHPDQIPGGRYHIVERLSTSAIGAVYKALDTVLDRPVAVKCVRLDTPLADQSPDELRERFVREARIAARLQHPNIVTIHDIVATPDRGYIIMEFIEGRTLESLIGSEGRLPLSTAIKVLSQLASALDYAHDRNVVHRDVKPSNILVSPAMYVWVTDFGIAKSELSTNLTMAGGVLGTPDYMSPEQAKGEDVDARSDLFSLGCILFESVVGEKPFRSPSLTGVLLSIINDEPVFPLNWRTLGLPTELKPILHHSLEKDRAKRYADGADLMAALESISKESVEAADAAATGSSPKCEVSTSEPAEQAEPARAEQPTEGDALQATPEPPAEADAVTDPESSVKDEEPPVESQAEASPSDEEAAVNAQAEEPPAPADEPSPDNDTEDVRARGAEDEPAAKPSSDEVVEQETALPEAVESKADAREAESDGASADDDAEDAPARARADEPEDDAVSERSEEGEPAETKAELAENESAPDLASKDESGSDEGQAEDAPEAVAADETADATADSDELAPESKINESHVGGDDEAEVAARTEPQADDAKADPEAEGVEVDAWAKADDVESDAETPAAEATSDELDIAEDEPPPLSSEDIQALKDESQVLHLSPTLSGGLEGAEISPEEGFLLSRIDGASRPNDILSVSPMAEADTARALMDLLGKGLIKLGGVMTEPAASAPEPPPPTKPKPKPKPKGPDPEVIAEVDRLLALYDAEDYPALFGLSLDASASQRKSAYLKIVSKFHPDKFSSAADDFRDKLSRLCASASDAVSEFEKAVKKEEAIHPQPVRPTNARSSVASNGSDPAPFDRRRHARELYDRALVAFDRADYWDAIQLGRQAVETDDQVPEFHGLLGRALLQNKKWRKEAADSFLKASQLEPNNIEYIGMLGAIYQGEGLNTRARALLERARTIDPDFEFPDVDEASVEGN